MQLQCVITILSLDENIDEKWTYVTHYGWHPLMVGNKVAFAIIFEILYIND